jgi:predicted TIM-barrel fold metal-dependent hydrolase
MPGAEHERVAAMREACELHHGPSGDDVLVEGEVLRHMADSFADSHPDLPVACGHAVGVRIVLHAAISRVGR